jgi:hypothetical protein
MAELLADTRVALLVVSWVVAKVAKSVELMVFYAVVT